MLYVIFAAENLYQGLHGMCDWSIWDCCTEEEVISIAQENSIEVINSYHCIYDTIEADIEEYINNLDAPPVDDQEIEDIRESFYQDDICYDIYEIDKKKIGELDIDTLEQILNEDPEDFIKTYCLTGD